MKLKGISDTGLKRIAQVGSADELFSPKKEVADFMSDIRDKTSAIVSAIDQVFYNLSDRHWIKDSDPDPFAQAQVGELMEVIQKVMQTRQSIFECFDLMEAKTDVLWDAVDREEGHDN